MQYRFIGTLADVGGVRLSEFGQAVELDEATAKHPRGPAVIPADAFEAIGFTAEELSKFKHPGPRSEAPAEFQTKYKAALVARHEFVFGGGE